MPGAGLDHCAEARIRAFSRFHAACDLNIPIPYLRFAIKSSTVASPRGHGEGRHHSDPAWPSVSIT
jgi:hypothetical protein